jgi:hypothetical protein
MDEATGRGHPALVPYLLMLVGVAANGTAGFWRGHL